MRLADPVLRQDLDRSGDVGTVFTIDHRQPDRDRPTLHSGEPEAHPNYVDAGDPGPEHPTHKV